MSGTSKATHLTRRRFLMSSTCAGTGLLVSSAVNPVALWADVGSQSLAPYLTGLRMAATPATAYRAYRSKVAANPDVKTWVQIDLGKSVPIDAIRLFPASERMYPGRDQYYAGEGFPLRFVIEAADDEALSAALVMPISVILIFRIPGTISPITRC